MKPFYFRAVRLTLTIVLAIFVAAFATVMITALHLRSIASDIEEIPRGEIVLSASEPESEFTQLISKYEDASRRLDRWLWPYRLLASTFGWVPWIGDQLEAVVGLGDLAVGGGEIAVSVQRILVPMTRAFDAFEGEDSDGATGQLKLARSALVEAEGDLEILRSSAGEARAIISELDTKSLIPPLEKLANSAASSVNLASRVIETLESLDRTLVSLNELIAAVKDLEDAIPISNTTMEELLDSSSSMENVAMVAEDATGELVFLRKTLEEELGFRSVSGELNFAAVTTFALSDSLRALVGFNKIIEQIWLATRGNSHGFLSTEGPTKAIVLVLVENEDQLVDQIERISRHSSTFLDASESSLFGSAVGQFGVYIDRLKETEATIEMVAALPSISSYLTGLGSDRLVLVLGQSADELRGAGGFTSSVVTMSMVDGSLQELEFAGSEQFDIEANLSLRPAQPDVLRLHMQSGALYMRDIGWSPDFEVVGNAAAELYELDHGSRPDTVVAINQWALVRLAGVLGGIETANGTIAANDVIANLEQGTDEQGTEYIGVLINDLLSSISGDTLAEKPIRFLLALKGMIDSKELMVWASSSDVQEQLVLSKWSGSLPENDGDQLIVVDSNIGWNKVDRMIDRSLTYDVDLSNIDQPVVDMTIKYTNRSESNSRNCELHGPFYEANSYVARKDGCYWNYVRIYPSGNVEILSADPLPAPVGATAVRSGSLAAGTPTFELGFDETGYLLGGLVFVEPGESRTVNFRYTLDSDSVVSSDETIRFDLAYFAQPGVLNRDAEVSITFPDNFQPSEATIADSFSSSGQTVVYKFDGTLDKNLSALGKLAGSGAS